MWFLTILVLIFILGIIILVHELGHFYWAKKFGVHIYEFSIGMGPIFKSIKGKDGIDYNLRVFPIGGFVQMAGEVYEDDNKIPAEKFMCNKPWIQRVIILVAGVINNFILAIIVLFFLSLINGPTAIKPEIGEIVENSAAEKAGLETGDTISKINGKKVGSWDAGQIYLYYKNADNTYKFEVKKANGETKEITVNPDYNEEQERYVFGFGIKQPEETGMLTSIKYSFQKFGSIIDSMRLTISGLFTGKLSIKSLSGPVGMYKVVEQGMSYGIAQIAYILAFLSINVGFINILPFPAFDGGRIVFLIIEKIRKKPIDSNLENKFHTVGFILLLILMIYITFQDIINLF